MLTALASPVSSASTLVPITVNGQLYVERGFLRSGEELGGWGGA